MANPMEITILVTASLILLYLVYPFWMILFLKDHHADEIETEKIDDISLILLSYNGRNYLGEKIRFLLKELSVFRNYELIIIDDQSTDGSQEILDEFRESEHIKIICKTEHKGIPHTMNTGIENAKFQHIIFCDQRQFLSDQILQRLVEPLKYRDVGAVSACMSHYDKSHCFSRIRWFENFIKARESRAGSLIGVYGPLYAIKQSCYSFIPEYIILDDLYLSLKIIEKKQIRLVEECQIIDENPGVLYDYNRAKRYVRGFQQLWKERGLIRDLSNRQLIMLIWHKYMRLLIPVFMVISYTMIGIMGISSKEYLILFALLTVFGLVSFLPGISKFHFRLKNLFRFNVFYFFALIEIFIQQPLLKQFSSAHSLKKLL